MLYVTLAYDWFLFGHKLRTRMEMGEEILRFAFSYLAEVAGDTSLSVSAKRPRRMSARIGPGGLSMAIPSICRYPCLIT
ncbi:unnamed protein product [Echinostoma caproni]|uniref:Uncharacterized protein n=1 Tax=Echinostoma caproni TaxID=27848 RepID=A0A183ASZ3_9TREM|nr:unnamed protein product [Echinostoma caproni]